MENEKNKKYDLADRTLAFAKRTALYIEALPKTITNLEYGKQLARSSGSVGANYLEAEESLSKKDFAHRIKISRKEAKESRYWLDVSKPLESQMHERAVLYQEATELLKIFSAIVNKSK